MTLRLRSVRFALWRARLAADFVLAIAGKTKQRPLVSTPHVRALQPFIQCELRFLSLGRKRSAHPHFFGCQSARTLFRSRLILIPGYGLRLWLVLR